MKFFADESIDLPIVDNLRKDGHFVLYVAEIEPGIQDNEVLKRANKEKAVLLTSDKDFGELIFRQGLFSQGIILVRLKGLSPKLKGEIVSRVIQKHSSEIRGVFTVITPSIIRIRK
jgi:predicted nuclease of predicted toxin-antitoxin system